ncbi:Uncharacterised protein [Mycobacteroides abscessus subsp. abscessus]|nr:Uncharacterised protein [Mycobacteroides abscessus subsp. abscessus]
MVIEPSRVVSRYANNSSATTLVKLPSISPTNPLPMNGKTLNEKVTPVSYLFVSKSLIHCPNNCGEISIVHTSWAGYE